MDLKASRPLTRRLRTPFAAVAVALCLAGSAQSGVATLSASCGQGCAPSPAEFQVPSGATARAFAIRSLSAGKACSETAQQPLKGFSIRKGPQTVFVYYIGPYGAVSDPVPLQNLELPPGTYHLYAVPATGAAVTIVFRLDRNG